MTTEAQLLNSMPHRAESLEDRAAIRVIALALDGDGDALKAVHATVLESGGTPEDFVEMLVGIRRALADLAAPQDTGEIAKALGDIPGVVVEEFESGGFLAYVPRDMHGETLTGPDGLGMTKLLAGSIAGLTEAANPG